MNVPFLLIAAFLRAPYILPAQIPTSSTVPYYYLNAGNPQFKEYSGIPMRLGNGFKAMGGDTLIKVTLIGNDALDSGSLYFLDPVTGKERFLFTNKDTARFGEQVDLGKGLRGAPIVFKYVNSTDNRAKYTGANVEDVYRFDDPLLVNLAVNNRAMPVSPQLNSFGDRRWAVAGRASRTDVLFGFEDLAATKSHDFNDIVFMVTGVQLDSEIKLASPLIDVLYTPSATARVDLSMPPADVSKENLIFYTVDGTAPIFDDNGPVGSSTRVYSGPFTLAANGVVQALVWRPSIEDSTIGVTRYLPSDVARTTVTVVRPVQMAGGAYFDEDGDGRIDAARILLREAAVVLPAYLLLEDPFRPEKELELTPKDLSLSAPGADVLIARFPDRPFAPGTGFPTKAYGFLPPGSPAYPSGTLTLQDSVGPVLASVEASPPSGGNPAWMQVVFSEDVAVELAGKDFPFAIRRARLPDPTGKVKVASIRKVDGRTYLYVFDQGLEFYPVPGDSLRLLGHPSVRDLRGIESRMSFHIPVRGAPANLRGDILATGGSFTVGEPIQNPIPLKLPVSLVMVSEGGPGAGSLVCLDCRTGEWKVQDSNRPGAFPEGPRIHIRTKGAFAFDVAFFSHLGQFVNRAQGMVTTAMLAEVPADSHGDKNVYLMWYPVSASGAQAGTGAYIAQGTYQSLAGPGTGRQGEPVRLAPVRSRIGLKFGYIRK